MPNLPAAVAELLATSHPVALGPGAPNESLRAKLKAACALLPPACAAGLWLRFDFLDESHAISQELHSPEGSYWHGILHRREPDFSNAAYWFRRVPGHAVYEPLRVEAARLAADGPARAAFLRTQAKWDPFAFIDLCEADYKETAACHQLCRLMQRAEWELLFGHCWRQAAGE